MSLSQQLVSRVQQTTILHGAGPSTVSVDDGRGLSLELDVTGIETIGCSFRELRVVAPHLSNATLDVLKKWGNALCQRITYLLENIGPLEFDTEGNQVLIRSMPPDRQTGSTKYYEIMLSTQGNGNFSLRRYRNDRDQPGREQVDIETTYEVLGKLVADLEATLPTSA